MDDSELIQNLLREYQIPSARIGVKYENSMKILRKLDLSELNLQTFPEMESRHLQVLNLSQNSIEIIPRNVLDRYPKLKILDLSKNMIEEVDISVNVLNHELQRLDISQNHLSSINIENKSLKHIKFVDLHRNRINSFPFIKAIRSVKELDLNFNEIEDDLRLLENYKSLRVLKLKENRLRELNLQFNTNLTSLDLSFNQISELVVSGDEPSKLNEINLSNNELTSGKLISLLKLPHLNQLDLRDNPCDEKLARLWSKSKISELFEILNMYIGNIET